MRINQGKRSLLIAVAAIAGLTNTSAEAGIAATDILVFQQGDAANPAVAASTPLYIQDLNPALTAQTTPVQSFNMSTQSSPLFTSNEGSDGSLTLSNNGAVVSFSGWTSAAGGTTAENTVLGRGAGTLDKNGAYTQPTSYSGTTGNQTRSAFSPDGVNYYFGDKAGMYYNGGSSILTNSINTRSIKGFGSNTYVLTAASSAVPFLQTVSPATPSSGPVTLTGLPGLSFNNNVVDFALLSSGNNGVGVPDTLYVTDNTGILKYSFNGTTWTAQSKDTAPGTKLSGITAVPDGIGADLYVTSNPTTGGSVLEKLTDSAAFNATIADSAASVLYTAPTGDLLRGVSTAPIPEPTMLGLISVGAMGLLARRRRTV